MTAAAGRSHRVVVIGGGFAGLQAVRALRRAPVEVTLRRLRPTDVEVLLLIAWEDLSPERAAAALGVRPGTGNVLPRNPRAGHRPTTARRVAAVAAVVAALVLAVGLPGDRSSRPGGLGRIDLAPAVAATLEPGDSILHIVTRTSQSGPRGAEHTWRTDVWLTPGGGGRVRVSPQNGNDASFAFTDSDKNARDPAAALHDMLEDGTFRSVGRGTLDGRAVETFRAADDEIVLYADAETMQPARSILERGTGQDRLIAVTDFLSIERLANTPENRRQVELALDS